MITILNQGMEKKQYLNYVLYSKPRFPMQGSEVLLVPSDLFLYS